jgi:ABC-type uncharacterized transport system substrate-binding protein
MGQAHRHLLSVVLGSALMAPASLASAERRVLIVAADTRPAFEQTIAGFTEALASRGLRIAAERATPESLASTRLEADVVLVLGSAAAQAVLAQPKRPPMVHAIVADPGAAGLHAPSSTAVWGVSAAASFDEQLLLVRAVSPAATRLGVLGPRADIDEVLSRLSNPNEAHNLRLIPIEVTDADGVAPAILAATDQVDAVLALPSARLWRATSLKAAVLASLRCRRPLFGFATSFTKSGAIASQAPENYAAIGARAADLAFEIFNGRSASLPRLVFVEHPQISINLVVADRLGVQPTRRAIDLATEVFR